jgi:hypothetical protein
LFQGGDKGILGQLLGNADVTDDACDPRNDSRRLDPPDRVDRTMCISGCHNYRSHHLQPRQGKARV